MNFYTHDELTTAIILVYQKFGRGQLQVVVSFYCTRIVQVRHGAIIPADFPRSISLTLITERSGQNCGIAGWH